MKLLSPVEESKPTMCLSPQEKLKGVSSQRNKRSHAVGALTGASDAKKVRLDDMFKNELELELDGWISDDYLRAMDFDDSLNQDIDWVAHDEMDLALSMDALVQDHTTSNDDVSDFGFSPSSFLRSGLALEDLAEMASTFVDPAYIRLEPSSIKVAEELLMSFDTMNFNIPSPTSASSKKRSSDFLEKDAEVKQEPFETNYIAVTADTGTSASSPQAPKPTCAEETHKEQCSMPTTSKPPSSLSVSTPVASVVSAVNVGAATSSSKSTEKKIGIYSPAARKLRLQKFHQKRKNRTWKKSIKYDCRKKLADDRPRIKGRFVRVLENASDTKTSVASCSPTSVLAGYASPTSSAGGMAASKAKSQVAAPCLSTLASAAKQSSASVSKSVASPASNAALPFSRMIASV